MGTRALVKAALNNRRSMHERVTAARELAKKPDKNRKHLRRLIGVREPAIRHAVTAALPDRRTRLLVLGAKHVEAPPEEVRRERGI